jgi:hypothetical protein
MSTTRPVHEPPRARYAITGLPFRKEGSDQDKIETLYEFAFRALKDIKFFHLGYSINPQLVTGEYRRLHVENGRSLTKKTRALSYSVWDIANWVHLINKDMGVDFKEE